MNKKNLFVILIVGLISAGIYSYSERNSLGPIETEEEIWCAGYQVEDGAAHARCCNEMHVSCLITCLDLYKLGVDNDTVTACLDYCDEKFIECADNIPLTCEELGGHSCTLAETCPGEYLGETGSRCCSVECEYRPIMPFPCTEFCWECPEETPFDECIKLLEDIKKFCSDNYICGFGYGNPFEPPIDPDDVTPPNMMEACFYIKFDVGGLFQDCVNALTK